MSKLKNSLKTLGSIAAIGGLVAASPVAAVAQMNNPCAPRGSKSSRPCAPKTKGANPCAAKSQSANPCAPKSASPCAPKR